MANKDLKPWFYRWVLLLQEFDFEVKEKKRTKIQVAHHFSKLEDEDMSEVGENSENDDAFPNEHVSAASQYWIPWLTDLVNYLANDIVLSNLSFYQWKKFMHDAKKFFRYEPYLYRSCTNGIIRCCVPK